MFGPKSVEREGGFPVELVEAGDDASASEVGRLSGTDVRSPGPKNAKRLTSNNSSCQSKQLIPHCSN
jgi:hypothetical protein